MKKILLLAFIILTSCSSKSGKMDQSTGTGVVLKSNNYKVLKAGARGDSYGFYLLGLIPIVSPSYADAKHDLYQGTGHKLEGRSVALANQTEDTSTIYLILFSFPRITITADIVEFHDVDSGSES